MRCPAIVAMVLFYGMGSFILAISEAQESSGNKSVVTHLQTNVAFEGIVFEQGTERLLKNVFVYLLPQKIKSQTNEKGEFSISMEVGDAGGLKESKDPGSAQESQVTDSFLVVNIAGFEKFEMKVSDTKLDKNGKHLLFVRRERSNGFETKVIGSREKKDVAVKVLTPEEFLTVPGAGGDPVKAVQNLPGVNRVSGFSSQVVVQGAAPKDTSYNIDGHTIPLVFHFGGLTSVVMPEALESVEYLSAGYGVESSRSLGGLIGLRSRKPFVEDRKSKGFFFVDTLKAGGLFESQLDEDRSILLSARLSYVGLIVGKVLEKNDQMNLTVAPEFGDVTSIYNHKINENNQLRVIALGSRDTLGFLLKEPVRDDPSIRGRFYNETSFYRFVPEWSHRLNESEKFELSMGLGQDKLIVDIGSQYLKIDGTSLTVRGDFEEKWSQGETSHLGFDNYYGSAFVNVRLPHFGGQGGVRNPISSGEIKEESVHGRFSNLGLYGNHERTLGPWVFTPALRLDSFSLSHERLWEPRLAVKYQLGDAWLIKSAGGIYYQPPEMQEIDQQLGNPDLKAPRAVHSMLGFEKDFRGGQVNGFTWSGAYFDRWFDRLVTPSSSQILRGGVLVSENYNNDGGGRAYGFETQLRFTQDDYSGWISYTWSRSVRWDSFHSSYAFEYDQTHNLNIVASKDLPRDWKISGRFRYVTGNPFTPIVDSRFDADNDVYIPIRGEYYSERMKEFVQLDLRADKKFIADRQIWSLYIDIQNVLNQKNEENFQYSYNYQKKEPFSGLPFLPAIGVKGEF